jgi:GWxTD domain-containing protein
VGVAPARADKLDKDSKKWLDEVRAIVLPDEKEIYTALKDRGERVEFEKIFWARRDPDPSTPENGYKAEFEQRKAEADQRYKVPGLRGSASDCGRLYILLGEPDEVQQDGSSENRGARLPETWTYKSRPNMSFTGGQAQISVDAECRFTVPSVHQQLDRVAGTFVLNPNLAYKVQAGKITRLADLLPKPSPAQTLLKEPRQDFPLASQQGYLRAEGSTALFAALKADAAGLTTQESQGRKTAAVTVAAEALGAEGKPAASEERSLLAPVDADGSVTAGVRLFLKPGEYTLRTALVDDKSGRGSTLSQPITVPDLNKGELTVSVWVVRDVTDEAAAPDPTHALAAFVLGTRKETVPGRTEPVEVTSRIVPRVGGKFARAESVQIFYELNDAAVDPQSGKADVTVSVTLSKGTKVVAQAPDQPFETPHVINSVGPVPLEKYDPGTYTAKLKVRDGVAKKDLTLEQNFEIVP